METVLVLIAAWIFGGVFYIRMATAAAPNSDAAACLAGLRHGEVAAMVAIALFVVVWPLIFVGATIKGRREN